jgi:hypothetical protein
MRTTAPRFDETDRWVFAVPPLAHAADGTLDRAQNERMIRHIEAGGLTMMMYGGNANFYHLRRARLRGDLGAPRRARRQGDLDDPLGGAGFRQADGGGAGAARSALPLGDDAAGGADDAFGRGARRASFLSLSGISPAGESRN